MTDRSGRLAAEDHGAAAVELGLVLPILVLLVFGIVEFSRAYNAKISLSAAAREGARVMAIENDQPVAEAAVINAAPTLSLDASDIVFDPATCSPGGAMEVTVTYSVEYDIPMFDTGKFELEGIGVMRCGG